MKNAIRYIRKEEDQKYLYASIAYDDNEIRPERRTFNIRTYNNFRKYPEHWKVLNPINEFLETLDNDEYSILVKLFIIAKRELANVHDTDTIIAAVNAIGDRVVKTFHKLNLSERLHDYVSNNTKICIPDLSKVGTRPQDTDAMTFYERHYHAVNTIIVVNKLLFPIFGEIIFKASVNFKINSKVKEIFAFGILNKLLVSDFFEIANKLQNYTSVIVGNALPDNDLLVFDGLTKNCMADDKLAKILVKNLINFDLYQPGSDVMRYISVSIRKSTKSDTGSNKRITYKARYSSDAGDDEESNTSTMENEGHMYKETLDIPVIVKFAVERFIREYILANNIRQDIFDEAYNYYMRHAIPPTPVNEILAAIFIDDHIGGSYGIKYVNATTYIKLIVLIQLYMSRTGFETLIPLMSFIPTGNIKTVPDEVDNNIKIKEGVGHHYRNVKEMTKHLDDFFKWEDHFRVITEFIINQTHKYNVAPCIDSIIKIDCNTPEGLMKYDKDVISEIYRFIYHLMVSPGRGLE